MSHIPFTILAYLLNSVSVTTDKFLLTKHIPDPIVYVFYFSCFSLVALLLLPFTHIPSFEVLLLASLSTLLWTTGAYCMFRALQIGLVSRVIPVIGSLIPLLLLFEAVSTRTITTNQIWAISILILGLLFLTAVDWKGKIKKEELFFEILSAVLFAISYLVLREAYLMDTFLTVISWSRLILIPVGLIIIAIPRYRKVILAKKSGQSNIPKINPTGIFFLLGQMAGGSAELLLTFSVSLATPALVNSLQGVQYVFLFLFSLILARRFPDIYKERLSHWAIITKVIGILFISLGLYILAFFGTTNTNMKLGLTYSPRYAQALNLDPFQTYLEMLNDLHPQYLRLPIYWDEVEKSAGKYDFSKLDQYVFQAEQRNVSLILVVGFKQPRWPECYTPDWARNLSQVEKDQAILRLVSSEVGHFRKNQQIIAWQVENEPFLGFGICPDPHTAFSRLPEEISIVKNLDNRPILITDSGELSSWIDSMKVSDIFGTTLYRKVWNPYFGDSEYPLPPFFYSLKDQIAKNLTSSAKKETVISELQAEPWQKQNTDLEELPVNVQLDLFSISQFKNNVNFAKQTGFSKSYLWGTEWWYLMKSKGHPEYLDYAKNLFAR